MGIRERERERKGKERRETRRGREEERGKRKEGEGKGKRGGVSEPRETPQLPEQQHKIVFRLSRAAASSRSDPCHLLIAVHGVSNGYEESTGDGHFSRYTYKVTSHRLLMSQVIILTRQQKDTSLEWSLSSMTSPRPFFTFQVARRTRDQHPSIPPMNDKFFSATNASSSHTDSTRNDRIAPTELFGVSTGHGDYLEAFAKHTKSQFPVAPFQPICFERRDERPECPTRLLSKRHLPLT